MDSVRGALTAHFKNFLETEPVETTPSAIVLSSASPSAHLSWTLQEGFLDALLDSLPLQPEDVDLPGLPLFKVHVAAAVMNISTINYQIKTFLLNEAENAPSTIADLRELPFDPSTLRSSIEVRLRGTPPAGSKAKIVGIGAEYSFEVQLSFKFVMDGERVICEIDGNLPITGVNETKAKVFVVPVSVGADNASYAFTTFDAPNGLIPVGIWLTRAGINRHGVAVGSFGPIPGTQPGVHIRGLRYDSGAISSIDVPASFLEFPQFDQVCRPPGRMVTCSILHTIPSSINDLGQVVGIVGILVRECFHDPMSGNAICDSGVLFNSFLFSAGGFVPHAAKFAFDISNAGIVLGSDRFHDLDASSEAMGINSSGQIVWYSHAQGHGYVFSGGVNTELRHPRGSVTPMGINDNGHITGIIWADDGLHGFVARPPYGSADFTMLNVPGSQQTIGLGINAQGQVVGHFGDERGHSRFFIATPVAP